MKNSSILLALSLSCLCFAQVGINTVNLHGTLHVGGAKDNPESGTPLASQ